MRGPSSRAPSDLIFSIYGHLDASADTQWVRVMPIRESLLTEPGVVDAVVTLEEIETGTTVVMSDSLFRYRSLNLGEGALYAHNFSTTMPMVPGRHYRLTATRSDGASASAMVLIPVFEDPTLEVSNRFKFPATNILAKHKTAGVVRGTRHLGMVLGREDVPERCDYPFAIHQEFLPITVPAAVDGGDHLQLSWEWPRREPRPLSAMSVARFHRQLMGALRKLDIEVRIHGRPNEVPDPIPFERDEVHTAYNPEYASRFWTVMHRSALVLGEFRGRFIGKCSPVHYFWGAADLAVTRFSGRKAPEHPGGVPGLPDEVVREAYSHEVSSCGFWPGGGAVPYPAFYTYAYPEPPGYRDSDPGPLAAFYSDELREFILPYNAVRTSSDPEGTLLHFLQNTYESAAELGGWDRSGLERAVTGSEA